MSAPGSGTAWWWHAVCALRFGSAQVSPESHSKLPPMILSAEDDPPERGGKAQRRRELRALRERLAEFQARLVSVRDGTRALSEIEAQRRLTPAETRRARDLRWEGERLR